MNNNEKKGAGMEKEYDPVTGEEVEIRRKKRKVNYFDYSLLFVTVFLVFLGFVLLYSASSYVAQTTIGDAAYYLKRQMLFTGISSLAGYFVYKYIDYHFWQKTGKLIYFSSIISVLLILTPLGITRNGAKRWLGYGQLSFQPAEFVKLGVIVMTAYMLSKCGRAALRNIKTVWQIYFWTILAGLMLMVITSNLSSALIVLLIPLVMLFIAGAPIKFFLQGAAALGSLVVVYLIHGAATGNGFRISRIMVWLNPEAYADSGGYQVLQGLYAIGSGGLVGKGLGQSSQKLGFVPEAANDMIFSIVCEELGLFGAIAIILLFAFIIRRMRVIAANAPDLIGSMLVIGVMAQISLQTVLNIAVVTNSIPNTGISLPFISYGGTSSLFLVIEMAMVFSVSKRIKRMR